MAKDKATEQQATPQVSIAAQYVKDISFESPGAPASLRPGDEKPGIAVNVDVGAHNLGKDAFEVELKIDATAKRKNKDGKEEVVFICEVKYGGVFVLSNIPQQEVQPALLVYAPTLLFPFVRRIISDLTRDGGFPALMLDPIDFARLYANRVDETKK